MAKNGKPPIRHGEVLPPARREVGVRIGNQIFVPVLPDETGMANAQNGYLKAHLQAVGLMDQYFALREQYAANRSVAWRPATDIAAEHEEEAELKHRRKLAKLRREREVHEHALAVLEAEHALEAAEQFKTIKFAAGEARFAEKTAKYRVGEAVANHTMGKTPEARRSEEEAAPPPPFVDVLVHGIDDLEKQIAEREASGTSAERLHSERDALKALLMRELKKGR